MKAKPQPPKDLWLKIDQWLADNTTQPLSEKPANSRTLPELMDYWNASDNVARKRIYKLVRAKQLKFVGMWRRLKCYEPVE